MTEPDPEMILTMNDAQAVGFCPSGLRRWFRAHPHLDFRTFLRSGLRVGDLPLDDAGIQRIIAHKTGEL